MISGQDKEILPGGADFAACMYILMNLCTGVKKELYFSYIFHSKF